MNLNFKDSEITHTKVTEKVIVTVSCMYNKAQPVQTLALEHRLLIQAYLIDPSFFDSICRAAVSATIVCPTVFKFLRVYLTITQL